MHHIFTFVRVYIYYSPASEQRKKRWLIKHKRQCIISAQSEMHLILAFPTFKREKEMLIFHLLGAECIAIVHWTYTAIFLLVFKRDCFLSRIILCPLKIKFLICSF